MLRSFEIDSSTVSLVNVTNYIICYSGIVAIVVEPKTRGINDIFNYVVSKYVILGGMELYAR